jgi:acetoin utilization protein AcuC
MHEAPAMVAGATLAAARAVWTSAAQRAEDLDPSPLRGCGHFDPLTAFETGYNPSDPVDRAIMATRKAVFPLHGLMP